MPGDREKNIHIPIPTYDEAVAERPSSSQSFLGQAEVSDDAERQGLLPRSGAQRQPRRNGNYRAPTVESARASLESGYTSPAVSDDEDADEGDEDEAELRRDMEQMEVTDEQSERRAQQRARVRRNIQKRIASITNSFSSIHLPRIPDSWSLPSFSACFGPFRRIAWPSSEGFSYTVLARVILLLIIVTLVYVLIVVRIFPSGRIVGGARFDPGSVRDYLVRHVDPSKIRANLKQVSYDDHMAGTKGDFFLAEWVKKQFQDAGLDEIFTEDFQVYLNYPTLDGRRVSITSPPELVWTATLAEDNMDDLEHLEGERHQAAVFHGHSKSGTVNGPLIYANYGSRSDFALLRNNGIDLNGTIALVRQYGPQPDPALKVKAAADAGAIGCLIYSDPADDGATRGAPGPDGPWRTMDGVQRGAVSLMPWIIGDVLTPGWASTTDADRQTEENNPGLPRIPSLPLSARDGQTLVRALQGQGRSVPSEWTGGFSDTSYWTGSRESSPTVELKNEQDVIHKQPIRNVLGRIHGSESLATSDAPVVYVGSHRDAWCFGGVDPGSGTSVLVEAVRIFGSLLAAGWRPRRSIVFSSWDAGDYNFAGSTEHVEARLYQLRQRGIAYVNVDRAVYGQEFHASGSPVFSRALSNALDYITDPRNNDSTLLNRWEADGGRLKPPVGRADYVPFQSLAGVSSLDIGFSSDKDADTPSRGYGGPAFPAQSCHDTMKWMETHGDPMFSMHSVLVQVLSLIVHDLSDSAMTPLDLRAYSAAIGAYSAALGDALSSHPELQSSVAALRAAADLLNTNAGAFMQWDDNWAAMQAVSGGGMGETRELAIERADRNRRKTEFESRLLDVPTADGSVGGAIDDSGRSKRDGGGSSRKGGIPGREQFKHILYGPRAWGLEGNDDEAAAVFPGIRDAMDAGDWDDAGRQVQLAADIIKHAAEKLVEGLPLPQ